MHIFKRIVIACSLCMSTSLLSYSHEESLVTIKPLESRYTRFNTLPGQNFLRNRLPMSDKRYLTMSRALDLLTQTEAKILIETGTARNGELNYAGDGGSTVIFADWAKQHQATFYSVDIDPQAVYNAQMAVQPFTPYVSVICSDSVSFLETFAAPIDFLYLDSYDFDVNNPFPSQMHHLKEIIAAYPKLHENSIVMIDDCDLPHGGKGLLAIKYLLERDWKIILQGYQTILSR